VDRRHGSAAALVRIERQPFEKVRSRICASIARRIRSALARRIESRSLMHPAFRQPNRDRNHPSLTDIVAGARLTD